MRWAVGVDLGGTLIKGGLVNEEGRAGFIDEWPTNASKGREYVLEERLLPFIQRCLKAAMVEEIKIEGVGIAVASPLDPRKGVLYNPPNLPGWGIFPLLPYLQKRISLPIYIDNDANLFALGEWRWGAGERKSPLVCLTLGTGIGGGIIYDNGAIWHGSHGTGGELGHITVDMNGPSCNCGNRGCLEAMASATALERWFRTALKSGRSSLAPQDAKAKEIFEAACDGDPLAIEAFQWAGKNLGVGLASLANIFDPKVIVLGGGLSTAGMLLLRPAVEEFRKRALYLQRELVEIKQASLGKLGGVLGAALLALNKTEGGKS